MAGKAINKAEERLPPNILANAVFMRFLVGISDCPFGLMEMNDAGQLVVIKSATFPNNGYGPTNANTVFSAFHPAKSSAWIKPCARHGGLSEGEAKNGMKRCKTKLRE
jgi:hypothetical protein